MIKNIVKIGMIVGFIAILLIALFFQRYEYVLAFIAGYLASNLNLYLNMKLLDIGGSKNAYIKNFSGFLLRMLVYAIVLIFVLQTYDTKAMILAFIGCLTIRISILIYGIKGGIIDGDYK